jgi:hypothetical protein
MDHSYLVEKQGNSDLNPQEAKGWRSSGPAPPGDRTRQLMAARKSMLGRKQEETIAALLTQRNLDEAAKAAGISMRTLMRWLKLPEFQAAYREARRTAYSQAVAKLQQGATAAATTLLKVMVDQSTPASVKVRAAECVMNHSSKAIEIEDVEFRVAELERAAEAQKKKP